MKYALVTTTINTPHNLKDYVEDIIKFEHKEVIVVVAGDIKTPPEVEDFCEKLTKNFGVKVLYLTPEDQALRYPAYSDFLGWNTIQRRNIAILTAYHAGADVIITIDDDNFLKSEDYITKHGVLNERTITEIVESNSGWYNICRRMRSSCGSAFYPRGYSVSERGNFDGRIQSELLPVRSVVNAGLWLGDPDIDAVTRLAINPKIENISTTPFALAKDTYCPFNSQNTAIHRDAIPAYCMISGVGRYDDIVSSYFVKRIADHLGHAIRFGAPVVEQQRNAHNLWKDLDSERLGMQLTDRLVEWLRDVRLKSDDYGGCLDDLLDAFRAEWYNNGSLTVQQQSFMRSIYLSYEAWGKAL